MTDALRTEIEELMKSDTEFTDDMSIRDALDKNLDVVRRLTPSAMPLELKGFLMDLAADIDSKITEHMVAGLEPGRVKAMRFAIAQQMIGVSGAIAALTTTLTEEDEQRQAIASEINQIQQLRDMGLAEDQIEQLKELRKKDLH